MFMRQFGRNEHLPTEKLWFDQTCEETTVLVQYLSLLASFLWVYWDNLGCPVLMAHYEDHGIVALSTVLSEDIVGHIAKMVICVANKWDLRGVRTITLFL